MSNARLVVCAETVDVVLRSHNYDDLADELSTAIAEAVGGKVADSTTATQLIAANAEIDRLTACVAERDAKIVALVGEARRACL